jgi:hypothetical protein
MDDAQLKRKFQKFPVKKQIESAMPDPVPEGRNPQWQLDIYILNCIPLK